LAGQLPANVTETTLVLVRLTGAAGVVSRQLNAEVSELPVERAAPIRRFYSWPGKRNYDGRWWLSTSGRHVVFESLLERDAVMMADFDSEVVAVSAQPLAFLWPRGTEHETHHVPDFFFRLCDGGGRIVDVKPADALTRARTQIALTEAACTDIGWQYDVFTGVDSAVERNVRWLSGYRHGRYRPGPEVMSTLEEVFTRPAPLSEGAHRAASRCAVPMAAMVGHLYHCLWTHHLRADLKTPLTMTAVVSR
jgi:hypothetical protein